MESAAEALWPIFATSVDEVVVDRVSLQLAAGNEFEGLLHLINHEL